jgi:hypothetical protein
MNLIHVMGLLCTFLCTEGNKLYPNFSGAALARQEGAMRAAS